MRPRFRRVHGACGGALAALVLWLSPGAAWSAETASIKTGFSPYKLGSPTTLKIEITIADSSGGTPGPVTSFDTRLPPRLELVGSTLGLAICQPEALQTAGLEGCSSNAQVGTGSARVDVPFGPEVVRETAGVTVLMGPSMGENVGILLFAEGRTPVFAQSVFPGVLVLGGGPESLDTTVPVTPTLPGAPDASVTNMQLSIGPSHLVYHERIHGRTVAYKPRGVSLPARCPAGGFEFVTNMTFQDGTHLQVPSNVPCPRTRARARRG